MPDFAQHGLITTLHDLGAPDRERDLAKLENALRSATQTYKIGLILPVTADDMRADPFGEIVDELQAADYVDTIVVVMGVAPDEADFRDACGKISALGEKARVLWTDGPRVEAIYQELTDAGIDLTIGGKGRSAWTAFGYLLADARLKAFVLHDCDIVDYDRLLLARLCLPMAHPSLDFEFCKAYYARVTDQLYGRVVRLLVAPFVRALLSLFPGNRFLRYIDSFRYPLSGEFAVTSTLARSNRVPSDWGLEVGTLAEVFRNTSLKRVCQVDLCRLYEHKHQSVSIKDKQKGLMKMAGDICSSILSTLASAGLEFGATLLPTLRETYLRGAQDAIRQYHADALINGLDFNRHREETTVEAFAEKILEVAGDFLAARAPSQAIPNWTRVLTSFPDLPSRLRQAAVDDARDFA